VRRYQVWVVGSDVLQYRVRGCRGPLGLLLYRVGRYLERAARYSGGLAARPQVAGVRGVLP